MHLKQISGSKSGIEALPESRRLEHGTKPARNAVEAMNEHSLFGSDSFTLVLLQCLMGSSLTSKNVSFWTVIPDLS